MFYQVAMMKKEDALNPDLEAACEYYHMPRAQYPTAPGWAVAQAYHISSLIAPSPTDVVPDPTFVDGRGRQRGEQVDERRSAEMRRQPGLAALCRRVLQSHEALRRAEVRR